jgi:hypothetical protein
MWTVVPDIYNVFTAPHIKSSIFIWTYIRRYWRYIDSSMCVILQPWCQIQGTSSSLRYLNCGSRHIQCTYSSTYAGFNNQQTYLRGYWRHVDNSPSVILQTWCQYSVQPPVYAMWTVVPDIYNVFTAPHIKSSIFIWTYIRRYWWYIDSSMCVILQPWCQIQGTSSSLRYLNCGSRHIQCTYSSTYAGFNNQQTYLRGYWRHVNNSARIILQTWCQYSAHPPDYALWTVVPDIYSVITAPHIQASIFNWTYLRCYRSYFDNSMRFILQTWSQI